jgi:toxin YoeB
MIFKIEFKNDALDGIAFLKKSDPVAYKRVVRLLEELEEHPYTGTGRPEILKYDLSGKWSRRISQKHRLIYQIFEKEVIVLILSASGHYFDK